MSTLDTALHRFDEINAQDPRIDIVDGEHWPREQLYGRRMSEMLHDYAADPPEAVQLAARSQHLRRWAIPREDYPEGRAGYRQWRTDLGRYHAELAAEVLAEVGYGNRMRERVAELLQKKNLRNDPDVQLLEDVICLVFMKYYLEDFAAKHPREKLVHILQRTWKKMSVQGQEAALAVPLSGPVKDLVNEALSS